jgi:hypothetical protein
LHREKAGRNRANEGKDSNEKLERFILYATRGMARNQIEEWVQWKVCFALV